MKFYQSNSQKEKKEKYQDVQEKQKPKEKQSFFYKQNKKQNNKSEGLRGSILLKKQEQQQQGWCKKLCACTQLDYYKDYFKVTNKDVKKRISSNLLFWKGKFFEPLQQDYDFYGPFWIHTTIVFCLGAVHNILKYQGNSNFQYNYEILGEAFFLMYVLGFGLPIAIGFIFKGLGMNSTISQILCLWGYSASIYIIVLIACSFNICLLHWIFLAYGAFNKFYFIYKNVNQGFEIPASKKIIITIIIAIQVALQVLLFKIRFIQCAQFSPTSSVVSNQKHMSQNSQFIHFRNYEHQTISFEQYI